MKPDNYMELVAFSKFNFIVKFGRQTPPDQQLDIFFRALSSAISIQKQIFEMINSLTTHANGEVKRFSANRMVLNTISWRRVHGKLNDVQSNIVNALRLLFFSCFRLAILSFQAVPNRKIHGVLVFLRSPIEGSPRHAMETT